MSNEVKQVIEKFKEVKYTLKEVAPVLIERLEEIINDYYRSGSDEELLKGYSGVNIILKKVLLDNEVANGKLTQDSAADLMKKYNHAWAILTNPELKKTYDLKLARVRRRDAIKNEKISHCGISIKIKNN